MMSSLTLGYRVRGTVRSKQDTSQCRAVNALADGAARCHMLATEAGAVSLHLEDANVRFGVVRRMQHAAVSTQSMRRAIA